MKQIIFLYSNPVGVIHAIIPGICGGNCLQINGLEHSLAFFFGLFAQHDTVLGVLTKIKKWLRRLIMELNVKSHYRLYFKDEANVT